MDDNRDEAVRGHEPVEEAGSPAAETDMSDTLEPAAERPPATTEDDEAVQPDAMAADQPPSPTIEATEAAESESVAAASNGDLPAARESRTTSGGATTSGPDPRPREIVLVPARRSMRLPWLTWHYSAILPVALLALAATAFFAPGAEGRDSIAFRILEDGTGAPLAGIQVTVDDRMLTSDGEGIVNVDRGSGAMAFRVEGDGFPTVSGKLDPDGGARQQVSIPRLAAVASAGPVDGSGPAAEQAMESTPANSVPAPTAEATAPAGTPRAGAVRNAGDGPIEGIVLSDAGKPLQGARVTDGRTLVVTGKDGAFSIDRARLEAGAMLTISAVGFADGTVRTDEVATPLEVTLEARPIKAIYMNPNITTTEADVDRLIEIIDTTEANAIVLDIKEELIYYDSQVAFFRDAGTVRRLYDLPALLKKFQEHDIYTIARLVVFKDSLVAENRPDLAVLNNQTGELWRDMNGVSWVNPMVHELWEANSDLAVEAAEIGFDEIQYDYVRFPTDGDLSTMDFGLELTQENRENAIIKFLKLTREKLLPTGAKLSADVFGYTLLVNDDLGIGQNFVKLAEYVDYLSPMVYPSHFPEGSVDVDGHPNDFPYETIEISMRAGRTKLGGDASQIRPWLQDFSFFDMMPYGDEEVRAQIDAADEVGTSGWMLWDPNNEYHPGALDPDEVTGQPAAVRPEPARGVTGARRWR